MQEDFPAPTSNYLKALMFQDNETILTYLGWERKANEDRVKDGKVIKTWKDCLDYCLKYSYPEIARDKAGDQIMGDDGQPMKNRNWNPNYPHGYSIVYHFEEGQLESGSAPLFNAFCFVKPKKGEKLSLLRTGEKTETAWSVKRVADAHKDDVPEINVDEHGADLDTPF